MSKERKLNIIIGLKDVTDGEFGMLIRGKTEIALEAYIDLKESQDISLADEVIEMMLENLNQNKDDRRSSSRMLGEGQALPPGDRKGPR